MEMDHNILSNDINKQMRHYYSQSLPTHRGITTPFFQNYLDRTIFPLLPSRISRKQNLLAHFYHPKNEE